MRHLKKFNEEISVNEFENESGHPSDTKFYWLKIKNPRPGERNVTVGEYNSKDKYCWEIIASDEIFTDEEIRKWFDIGDEIKYTE